jgi:FkbM family methyltransferase
MMNLFKSAARASLRKLGYEVRSTRYVAQSMLDAHNVFAMDFPSAVCRLMHNLNRQQLTFLQVGAFDGVSCDPLRPFVVQYHWHGILIEPQPTAYEQLIRNYAGQEGLTFHNCAIADAPGEVSLFTVRGDGLPTWCGGLASFSRESIEKHEPFAPGISQRIIEQKVPTKTFDSILTEFARPELDILQTDTEGFDGELLKMFPFERIKPKIIHFERKHMSVDQLDEALVRLKGWGYRFALDGEEDMLASLSDVWSPRS